MKSTISNPPSTVYKLALEQVVKHKQDIARAREVLLQVQAKYEHYVARWGVSVKMAQ